MDTLIEAVRQSNPDILIIRQEQVPNHNGWWSIDIQCADPFDLIMLGIRMGGIIYGKKIEETIPSITKKMDEMVDGYFKTSNN